MSIAKLNIAKIIKIKINITKISAILTYKN